MKKSFSKQKARNAMPRLRLTHASISLAILLAACPKTWAGTCDATAVKKVEGANKEALAFITGGKLLQGWRKSRQAASVATRLGCTTHKVSALTNFMLGYVAKRTGKHQEAIKHWKRALKCAAEFTPPKSLYDNHVRGTFDALKKMQSSQSQPLTPGVCDAAALKRLKAFMNSVYADLLGKRNRDARLKAKQALLLAKKQKCGQRPVVAMIHFLAGVSEYRLGARQYRLRQWQIAFKMNPKLKIPRKLETRGLATHVAQVKYFLRTGKWVAADRSKPASRGSSSPSAACRSHRDCSKGQRCYRGRCVSARSSRDQRPPYSTHGYQRASEPKGPEETKAKKKPKWTFSKKGTMEFGGAVAFEWYKMSPDGGKDIKNTTFQGSLYYGYFPINYFVIGFSFNGGVSKLDSGEGADVTAYSLGVAAAPGVALPITPRTVFYADALVGLAATRADTAGVESTTKSLLLGGELGLKVLASESLMVRFGVQPAYLWGKSEVEVDNGAVVASASADSDGFRLLVLLGFSYWN